VTTMLAKRLFAVAAAAIILVAGQTSSASAASHPGLTKLRAATTKYHSLDRAIHDGFGLFTDTAGIGCIAEPGMGAMGVHYVNSARVGDPSIIASKPEAMVYRRGAHGVLRLVAVEYVVPKAAWDATHASPPRLFGHRFNFSKAPNRYGLPPYYSLHVWAFKHNPAGMFEMWNPTVHCHCS
jgi:hypothetical protein